MTQVTGPLVVNDGKSTPVALSFAPVAVSPTLSKFFERSAGASIGYKRITISFSPADAGRATNKAGITTDLPRVATVDGKVVKLDNGYAETRFVIPDTFTEQDRKDLFAIHVNAVQSALFKSTAVDLDPPN